MTKLIHYGLAFGVARGLLFFSPILMANNLPLAAYGQLELAHSYAVLGALILGLGLPSTVPLIILRDEVKVRWDALLVMISAIAGLCLLAGGFFAGILRSLDAFPALVLSSISVLIFQSLWANYFKSVGSPSAAVFVEGGFWMVALMAALGSWLFQQVPVLDVITAALMISTVGLMAITLMRCSLVSEGSLALEDFRRNISLGMPLMFTSVLTVAATSSGRILVSQAGSAELVGLYAVLYRVTSITLLVHQILVIALFRKIFSWPIEDLKKRAPLIVIGSSLAVLIFWLSEPLLLFVMGERFAKAFAEHRVTGYILLIQTILWSAIALNDLINSRVQIARRVIAFTLPYMIATFGGLGFWVYFWSTDYSNESKLMNFAIAHSAAMFGFFAVQCLAAYKRGVNFIKFWTTVVLCLVSVSAIILGVEYGL